MNDQQFGNGYSPSYVYQDTSLQRSLMQRVFLWMALGLGLTGLTSYIFFDKLWVLSLLQNPTLFYGLMIGEVALVWFLSARIHKLNFLTAFSLFGLYAVLNGVTLSTLLLIYTEESIVSTFFISAGMFGAMALFGLLTKRDLSGLGSILMMAVIGLIIASVVNIFLGNSIFSLIISCVGVLIFAGLTAYDVQAIKRLNAEFYEDDEASKKAGVIGALHLYLDFINIFIYLLRIMGSRK